MGERMRTVSLALLAALLVAAPAAQAADHGIKVRHQRVTFGHDTSEVTTVEMPRPTGNRVLTPALPGGIVSEGAATVSAVSGKLAKSGTAVAINADLFEYATGQPSGLLMIDGEVYNQPQGGRPVLQVDGDGTLHTSVPHARGTLTLPSKRTLPFEVNVSSGGGAQAVYYDQGWGPSAPSDATSAFIGRVTNGTIEHPRETVTATGTLRVTRTGATLPIPPDVSPDQLFQASGSAGRQLGRLRHGQEVGIRYRLGPLAPNTEFAIGGGPVLIHDGKIVFSVAAAAHQFTAGQLRPPDARTAVAQLRNGNILFYAADMGHGSTGLTISEVAKDLKRRGAVTAMAFDSGGSTSVAINGRLLNQPSDGVERAVGNQLVYFVGNQANRQPVTAVTVGKRLAGARVPTLSYTTVRRAPIAVSLTTPRGEVSVVADRTVGPGVHRVRIPASMPTVPGRWKLTVTSIEAQTDEVKDFTVTKAPVHKADTTPTNTPAGGPVPDQRTAPDTRTAQSAEHHSDPLPWVLLSLGLALALAAALAVLLVRTARKRHH
jgi:hypothetical protein